MSADPRFAVTPRGAIITIMGRNLASREEAAISTPLPTSLAGTSVTIDGMRAPLFYVSPTQINAQHPSFPGQPIGVEGSNLVVTTQLGISGPFGIPSSAYFGYAVFTLDGSGCGPAHVYNITSNGEWIRNSPENPATPGSYLAILGTGRGPVDPPLPDGIPTPADVVTKYWGSPWQALALGQHVIGQQLFEGRAPGMISVDQVNMKLEPQPRTPLGCNLPAWVGSIAVTGSSQTFPLSISRGPGPCVEPVQHDALLRWRKVLSSNYSPTRDTEELVVSLTAHAADVAESLPPRPFLPSSNGLRYYFNPGPPCPPLRRVKRLDAGVLTVTAGASCQPCRFPPELRDEEPEYIVPLPAGSVREGTARAEFAGNDGIGPFSSELAIPPPIQLADDFPPSVVRRPLLVRWTGGDPTSTVRVELRRGPAEGPMVGYSLAWEKTSAGWLVFDFEPLAAVIEIIVTNYKGFPDIPSTSAPGLPSIRHEWAYEWHYRCSPDYRCVPIPR
ncbi:MAG: IPT/TIG domain-containing protein [Acidobacteria bacterium]|nr:IPT/TIG domain-containing protein [Acidobacteriota bacterium]